MLRPALRSATQTVLRAGLLAPRGPKLLAPTALSGEYVPVFAPADITLAQD